MLKIIINNYFVALKSRLGVRFLNITKYNINMSVLYFNHQTLILFVFGFVLKFAKQERLIVRSDSTASEVGSSNGLFVRVALCRAFIRRLNVEGAVNFSPFMATNYSGLQI